MRTTFLATFLALTACAPIESPAPEPPWTPGSLGAPGDPARAERFDAFSRTLRHASSSASLDLLDDEVARGAAFTSREVAALLDAHFRTDRMDALERLYRSIVDPENGYAIVDGFWSSEQPEAARLLLRLGRPPARGGASCEALASGDPAREPGGHHDRGGGCTVEEVLALMRGRCHFDDERLALLRRVGFAIRDRAAAWPIVEAFPFDDDRARAWRLLF